MDKIDYRLLSMNPNAIHLLERRFFDKGESGLNWLLLCGNPAIFELNIPPTRTTTRKSL
jgi:hypothetical protein